MAGVGFRLKEYFEDDKNLWNMLKGSVYSAIVSAGPWLITVISIAFVSIITESSLLVQERFVFKSIVSYSFMASLLLFGLIEMPLTRYLADKLFSKDNSTFRGTFLKIVMFFIVVGSSFSLIFYSFFNYSFIFKLLCTLLFVSILVIWLAMVFLTATKNYHMIVGSFIAGCITSIVLTYVAGKHYGMTGVLLGFLSGQLLIAILLSVLVLVDNKGQEYSTWDFLIYYKKFRPLIFIGFLYYSGIWVDKIIFWFNRFGAHVEGLFYTNYYYDTAMFLAYISIIPSLAIFLVQVETNFYVSYSYYYHSIQRKHGLTFLNKNYDEIIDSLKRSMINLVKIQSFISFIIWYFADEIIHYFELPPLMVSIFRYGVTGAYLQINFLICNIVLLYFLAQRTVLFNYTMFFVLNLTLSALTSFLPFEYHGLGYMLSCLITLIISYIALNRFLGKLSFHTFMEQPFSQRNLAGDI